MFLWGLIIMKYVICLFVAILSASCSNLSKYSMFSSEERGEFLLYADEKGMNAFGEALNGAITTGKASPDIRDAYWQHQEIAQQNRTARFNIKFGPRSNK